MRKVFLLSVVSVFCLCSCNKQGGELRDYSCRCDNGQNYVIKNSAPVEATGLCDQYDNICPPGEQCSSNWNCSLD